MENLQSLDLKKASLLGLKNCWLIQPTKNFSTAAWKLRQRKATR